MEINRWTFDVAPPASLVEQKMGHYAGMFSEVAIRDGSEFFTLVPNLEAITNRVQVVLERFANRFN
jgi:hypothetical protein